MNRDPHVETYAIECDERAARFNRRAQIVCKIGVIAALAALGLSVREFAWAGCCFQVAAVAYALRSQAATARAKWFRATLKRSAR